MENILDSKVYVGTYKKYNNGDLSGDWLSIADYVDQEDFLEACKAIHEDEEDPEFMHQDWEFIPEELINEDSIAERLFDIINSLENLSLEQREAFGLWCTNLHKSFLEDDIDDLISDFNDDYIGEYESELDYAKEVADDNLNIPENILSYFDYKAYAEELFSSSHWCSDGHVFHNN